MAQRGTYPKKEPEHLYPRSTQIGLEFEQSLFFGGQSFFQLFFGFLEVYEILHYFFGFQICGKENN